MHDVRLAFGAVASRPWRVRRAEEVLFGAPATAEVFGAAADAELLDATLEQARVGAEALVVEYDEEPFDVTFSDDHPGLQTVTESPLAPPLSAQHGDVERELAASAVVVDWLYTTPGEHHVAIEPHAATARWADGRPELVDASQGSFLTARILADLWLDPAQSSPDTIHGSC